GYRLTGANDDTTQLFPNPQVLCSGLGASTTSATLVSIGACNIPGGFLAAGDRIEIHFDFDHQGTGGAYAFELHWGATTLLHRDPVVGDALATGRADVALKVTGAQSSLQSWGTVLPFTAAVGTASDDYFTNGIAIDFQAKATTGDTITLRNFTVIR